MSVSGSFTCQHCFHYFRVRPHTPCLSTILPRYIIESLRISHFDGLHFNPALFMHPKTSSSLSMWSSRVGVRYDYVIHVNTSRDSRTSWSLSSKPEPSVFEKWPLHCTSRRASSSTGNNPNSHANPVFSLSFFRRGTCQKAEPKSNVVKNLASPSLDRLSSISRYRVRIFYRYRVSSNESRNKISAAPPSFSPLLPRKPMAIFEGFYHVVFKQHFYFRSARFRLVWRPSSWRLPYGERRLLQVRFRVRNEITATDIRLRF